MKIRLFKPQNKLLQKYIECFYTLKRSQTDDPVSYLGFPSFNTFVVLYKNAEITLNQENITISHSQDCLPESLLIFDFEKSGACQYIGETLELTIYFKPLGLNAFLDKNLIEYKTASVSHFSPFSDYQATIADIFTICDEEKMMQSVEKYWLSKLRGFEHPFLEEIVAEIMVEDNLQTTISEIARQHRISRTTLNKHFARHIGTSPNQLKKIVRFRHAMKQFTSKSSEENLIDVAYLAEYFDQSHMIKDFKSLTGFSPKSFFAKLSQLENGQINWLFL